MTTRTVTPRQLQILRFIRDFRSRQGYSPTMQEIGDFLELTKVTVFEHVGALEKKGLLHRGLKHSARSLMVSEDFFAFLAKEAEQASGERTAGAGKAARRGRGALGASAPAGAFEDNRPGALPLVGRIAAGSPIEAIENRQSLDLQEMFPATQDTFVLRVAGQSMVEDHIQDGDYVICQRRREARNGETVVALLDDGEATLKRFYREKGRIRLQPANATFKPIYVDNVKVQGVVVGVVRKM